MQEIIETPFNSPMTWDAATMLPDDGRIDLDADCLREITELAEFLDANPLPIEALAPADFNTPALARTMAAARHALHNGIGFAIIDRLPLDDMSQETATKIYWLMMSMAGQPVAQKWDGTLVYDVLDTGAKQTAGGGVRSSKTNADQGYHTDNAFNLPPDCVGLMCIRPAKEGGVSGLVSFESVYNKLLSRGDNSWKRLYGPFPFDRQREHGPNEQTYSIQNIFTNVNGKLHVRFFPNFVRQGAQLAGQPLDDEQEAALNALREAAELSTLGKTFHFERGQIQIVNNRRLGHKRTGFTDYDDPALRRHLVRIWLRDEGRPFYLG